MKFRRSAYTEQIEIHTLYNIGFVGGSGRVQLVQLCDSCRVKVVSTTGGMVFVCTTTVVFSMPISHASIWMA